MKNAIQHKSEWNQLIKYVGKLDSFIEIGSYKGGTFDSLSKITRGKKISIDLCNGGFGGIGEKASLERNETLSKKHKNTYFIEGDSKKIETVSKLNDILGGEKVSLLFIDGDHTYHGVMSDFIIYQQFVKQDGFIVFHDIVDSEFHRNAGCFVHELWNKLDGISFISKDNSDCSEDAMCMGENIWGGIGVVKNDFKRNVHLFQIFYDQKSLDTCLNQCKIYLPTLIYNTNKTYFENAIISKIHSEYKFKENDYIGVTSPLLQTKTNLTIDDLVLKCKDNIDVINYGTSNLISGNNLDIWDENRTFTTSLYKTAKYLNDSKILPFDIFEHKWTKLYCNYWIAKTYLFEEYCEKVLNPSLEFFNDTEYTEWDRSDIGLFHRGRYYPICVFVLEGLFGTYLSNKNVKQQLVQ